MLRAVAKKSLPRVSGPVDGLGRPTIMDRALAASHGVDYVHLAAFAIDVDRVREEVEDLDDPRPFAWEVFLVEQYLGAHFDPIRRPEQVLVLEDVVLGVLEGARDALGSQIVFAIWDLVVRERFPQRLRTAFASWRARPDELVKDLAPLFAEEARHRRELAASCLEVPLDPPCAPPTIEALRALAE